MKTILLVWTLVFSVFMKTWVKENKYPVTLPQTVEEEFKVFVADFVRGSKIYKADHIVKERVKTLTVVFNDTTLLRDDHHFVGYCFLEKNEVWIHPGYWKTLSSSKKQALIDHELGHCLLGRIHRHAGSSELKPASIMVPGMSRLNDYQKQKQALRKELFEIKRFDKLPKLREDVRMFMENQVAIREFIMVDEYWFNQVFEDQINGDSTAQMKKEHLNQIVAQAQDVVDKWKQEEAFMKRFMGK